MSFTTQRDENLINKQNAIIWFITYMYLLLLVDKIINVVKDKGK